MESFQACGKKGVNEWVIAKDKNLILTPFYFKQLY